MNESDGCTLWNIVDQTAYGEPSNNLFYLDRIPDFPDDVDYPIVHNSDGSITVGTYTGNNTAISTRLTLAQLAPNLEVGETYVFNIDTTGSTWIYLGAPTNQSWQNDTTKTITQDMLNSIVYVYANGNNSSATIYSISIKLVKNLLNPTTIHQGTLNGSTGKVIAANNRCYFDFIKVNAGDVVYLSAKNNTPPVYSNIFIYSQANEDSFIRYVSGQAFSFDEYSGYKYTIPTDGYVRGLFLQNDNFTPADIVDAQMVIQKDAPTSYKPYY